MSTPATLTPHQTDLIKTAAGIIYVLDENTLHPVLRQTTPLADDQISTLARRFSDGLDRWDREVRTHHAPSLVDARRIAIVAGLLEQRYPDRVRRDARNEITIPVSDIVDAWHNLSGDITRYDDLRQRWEGLVLSPFNMTSGPDTGANTSGRGQVVLDQSLQNAQKVGRGLARSLGIDGIFNNVFEAGEAVESPVPPLPQYAANDTRSQHLQLMAKLQLELSVTEGLLNAIQPDEPHEDRERHLLDWFKKRATTALGTVTHLVVPSGIASLSSQLQDSVHVLTEQKRVLELCLYGDEPHLASAAAQHAVERSPGTILFLAICPNIPFVIPTLELRLIFTKPIYFLTAGAHEAMGDIPIFGFPFYVLMLMGRFIDGIPRLQVKLVQGIQMDRWLGNPRRRERMTHHYLRHVDEQSTKPRVDAVKRVLLSIVS